MPFHIFKRSIVEVCFLLIFCGIYCCLFLSFLPTFLPSFFLSFLLSPPSLPPSFLPFFDVLGFELSALHLLGRRSPPVPLLSPFGSGYFYDKFLFFPQANLVSNPPICVSSVAGMTGVYHHSQPLVEMRVS
jgi:hypothetical protein